MWPTWRMSDQMSMLRTWGDYGLQLHVQIHIYLHNSKHAKVCMYMHWLFMPAYNMFDNAAAPNYTFALDEAKVAVYLIYVYIHTCIHTYMNVWIWNVCVRDNNCQFTNGCRGYCSHPAPHTRHLYANNTQTRTAAAAVVTVALLFTLTRVSAFLFKLFYFILFVLLFCFYCIYFIFNSRTQ